GGRGGERARDLLADLARDALAPAAHEPERSAVRAQRRLLGTLARELLEVLEGPDALRDRLELALHLLERPRVQLVLELRRAQIEHRRVDRRAVRRVEARAIRLVRLLEPLRA